MMPIYLHLLSIQIYKIQFVYSYLFNLKIVLFSESKSEKNEKRWMAQAISGVGPAIQNLLKLRHDTF